MITTKVNVKIVVIPNLGDEIVNPMMKSNCTRSFKQRGISLEMLPGLYSKVGEIEGLLETFVGIHQEGKLTIKLMDNKCSIDGNFFAKSEDYNGPVILHTFWPIKKLAPGWYNNPI